MTIQQLPSISSAGLYNACEGSLYYITPSPSENMCVNPSFEFDTTNWTSTGTISRVVSGYSGYYALQAVLTASQTVTHTLARNPSAVQHAASIYIYQSSSSSITVNLQIIDTATIANRVCTIPANQWTRVQVAFTGRNTSTVFRIVASTSCTLRLDACQIEESAVGATTYFDGDSIGTQQSTQIAYPQYGWYGTAHKSASFRNRQATNGGIIVDLQQYGFQLISISGVGNPTFDNQIATYASTDGGILQDTVVPPREIAFLGRISGSTKTQLHQRLQLFMSLFQRDQVSYYQPRSWRFHHKSEREEIGQEISFSAVLVSAVAADITDQLSVDVTIQLSMTDPYFYGHDIAQEIPSAYLNPYKLTASAGFSFDMISTFQNGNQTDTASSIPYRYVLGQVTCVYVAPDGFIYVGYTNSTIVDSQTGTVYNFANLARFSPNTQTWSAVTSTNIYSGYAGVNINAMQMTPDKKYLLIGTNVSGGPLLLQRFIIVTVATGAYTNGGSFNNTIFAICIDPRPNSSATYGYRFFVGGSFTSINSIIYNRLAQFITTWGDVDSEASYPNNTVRSIAISINPAVTNTDPTEAYLIISGDFTAIAGITTLNCYRIAVKQLNIATANDWYALSNDGTTSIGLNAYAYSIIVLGWKDWIIGGFFTKTVNNATGADISDLSGIIRVKGYQWNLIPTSTVQSLGYTRYYGFATKGTYGPLVYKNDYLYCHYWSEDATLLLKIKLDEIEQEAFQVLLPVNVGVFDVDELGNVYFGQQPSVHGSEVLYSKPINFTNNGTASASLSFRVTCLQIDNTESFFRRYFMGAGNFSNQRVVQFIRPLTNPNQGYDIETNAPKWNVGKTITIDSRIGSATDSITGTLVPKISPNSDLYTLVAMPGTNVVYIHMYDKNETTATVVGTWEAVVKITQTYQSLFDGVNQI